MKRNILVFGLLASCFSVSDAGAEVYITKSEPVVILGHTVSYTVHWDLGGPGVATNYEWFYKRNGCDMEWVPWQSGADVTFVIASEGIPGIKEIKCKVTFMGQMMAPDPPPQEGTLQVDVKPPNQAVPRDLVLQGTINEFATPNLYFDLKHGDQSIGPCSVENLRTRLEFGSYH